MDSTTKQIARQRIQTLFNLAKDTVNENPQMAQHYVNIARRIAMATRLRFPTEYRRQVCRKCKRFVMPGASCRVRLRQKREPHIVISCLKCGGQTRIPLRNKHRRTQK